MVKCGVALHARDAMISCARAREQAHAIDRFRYYCFIGTEEVLLLRRPHAMLGCLKAAAGGITGWPAGQKIGRHDGMVDERNIFGAGRNGAAARRVMDCREVTPLIVDIFHECTDDDVR